MQAESDRGADAAEPDDLAETSAGDTSAVEDTEPADDVDAAVDNEAAGDNASAVPVRRRRRFSGARLVGYWLLPVLALLLALAAGYLKWIDGSAQESKAAAAESVRAASESTIAILSYRSDTVDRDLSAATDRLTGGFREQYKQLVGDVVAPGAKQQHITAVATVPAAASVSASQDHAVVMVFVDQTTTIGNDAPTQTTSSVRVTLDKVRGRWLISQFDPV